MGRNGQHLLTQEPAEQCSLTTSSYLIRDKRGFSSSNYGEVLSKNVLEHKYEIKLESP